MNYDIYRFDRIDSTNSHLLELGEKGFPEGTVVVADEQTAGRGRFGRSWVAEAQSNLLFSLLLRPYFLERDEIFILTFAAAVSIAEAIETVADVQPELKWPNDLLIEGKKVCGILLESSFDSTDLSHVVLGIGLNVNQQRFPGSLSNEAVSLSILTGKKFERDEILFAFLTQFSSVYESLQRREFYSVMKRWRERSNMFGKQIAISLAGDKFEGVCEEVADDGALVVRTGKGLEKFTAGEITIIR